MEKMSPMCACKGIRSCLICEGTKTATNYAILRENVKYPYQYCARCNLCWPGRTLEHKDRPLLVPGVKVVENFLSPGEEENLVKYIDDGNWCESQSGRRKQDYGPKVNFKKRKLNTSNFRGLPKYIVPFLERLKSELRDFRPVELCNLEYTSSKGSCIDPHFDDWWLWGPRLVTVNLLSDTVLTLSQPSDLQKLSSSVSSKNINIFDSESCDRLEKTQFECPVDNTESICKDTLPFPLSVIEIPLPRRSVVILSEDARYKWHHSIHRRHVSDRRLAITLRELSETFLENGNLCNVGKELLSIARNYI